MYDTHNRYVAVAFVDAESLKPTQKDIIKILESVEFLDLRPIQVQEVAAAGPSPRYGFATEDGVSQLVLLSNTFQFARIANQAAGQNLGDFSEFCRQAGILINIATTHFRKVPHRLAIIREGFIEKQEPEVNEIAQRLLTLPPVYQNKNLTEWDWRASAQIEREFGTLTEALNTIGIIKRVNATRKLPGDESPAPTENISLIRVDADINTSHLDPSPRFNSEHITTFFEQGISWHKEFESELLNLMIGGNENES